MNKTILNMLFSVVAVCETWLHKSNSDLFNIPGYHFISNSREHKLGGGVGLYIQSTFSLIWILSLGLFFNLLTIHFTNQSLWKSCDFMVKILLLDASIDLPIPLLMTLTGLLKISCQPPVLRISYLTLWVIFNINILNSHSHQPTNEFINLMTSQE